MSEEIKPIEEAVPIETELAEPVATKPTPTERLQGYANVFIHSLWMTMTLAGLLFVSFLFFPLKYQSAVTIWINPLILLLSLGKLYVDIAKHTGKPTSTSLTILASWILVLCSGFKTIADFRSKLFEPIHTISGSLHITFDRLISPDQLRVSRGVMPNEALLTTGLLGNQNISYFLTISNVQVSTWGKHVGTAITAEQVTHVAFTLTSESSDRSNHLNLVSSTSLCSQFDYITTDILSIEPFTDCSFDGVLYLVINGAKEYERSIPKQILHREDHSPNLPITVYVPLNEKALDAMYGFPSTFPKDPNFILHPLNR